LDDTGIVVETSDRNATYSSSSIIGVWTGNSPDQRGQDLGTGGRRVHV